MCSFFCSWRRRKQRRQKWLVSHLFAFICLQCDICRFSTIEIDLFAHIDLYTHNTIDTHASKHAPTTSTTHTNLSIKKCEFQFAKCVHFSARKKNLARESQRERVQKSIYSQITMTHHTHKWNRRNNINKVFESMNHGNNNKLLSV